MRLMIEVPDSFYSDLKENRIDLGTIGCQLLLDKVKNATPWGECEDAIKYFNTIHNLSQTCDLPYSFVENEIEKIMKALKGLPKEPCGDAISRQAAIDACLNGWNKDYKEIVEEIRALPPVTPQYTDAEIQKMQDLEFAEIQKAYEIGKDEGSEEHTNAVLDKIRAEIDEQYDRVHPYNISCAEGLEMALEIIDKYKASPTGEEVKE